MLRTVLWTLLTLAGLAGALVLLLGCYEPRLIYFPARDLERTPAALGMPFEDVELQTADGERIHGWFLPAPAPAPVTVLLLHGNAGNISHRFEKLTVLRDLGADVLIVDYRGYGRSSGRPTETGTYRDADAAYEYLVRTRRIEPRRLVLYGESLGAAVATDLAARKPVGGLVMESAFSSAVDVGQQMFPFLPARLLVRNRYESVKKIGSVQAPILILHSRNDEFFKWQHPQRLYDAAREPKHLIELRGGHNDAFLVSSQVYATALSAFLGEVAADALN
jgi:fermentation-respiration switch protein FrsA (DUF1100 family)